jgi:flagellar basal-body rod protein FlgF
MSGIMEAGSAIMRLSAQRLESVGHNIANANTPGYKRIIDFQALVTDRLDQLSTDNLDRALSTPTATRMPHLKQGALVKTGSPLDLAISGDGFFQVRFGETLAYSRAGQFSLQDDGRVADSGGGILQQAGGGDLVLDSADVEIGKNGLVYARGLPVARIPLFLAEKADAMKMLSGLSGSVFTSAESNMRQNDDVMIRQGMTEASNVQLDVEMVRMMEASRYAQTGARLVQLYDQLMGRAVTTLG